MSKKHLELYAPGESTQARVTEELQSRREARDEDENALVLRLHRQDVAELRVFMRRQLEVSFGDLTFLDGRQRVATAEFHNISLYKFMQMSSFEAFVSWYPSTRLGQLSAPPILVKERPEGKFEVIDGNTRCKIFMDIFAFLEEKRDLPKTFRRITQTDYTEHIEWIEETFNNNSNVAFRADFDNAMGGQADSVSYIESVLWCYVPRSGYDCAGNAFECHICEQQARKPPYPDV
ncbi:hypothetical protein QR680_009769 [Steinernema hermaphroditum]|uniref:Uncharacterized protein n=1 Tax=Steinernema hermaphroditum TaxID=289476 RepID=A0AA39ILL2_9BILA|nr:hypothetical protein QR680_009769 [Steinernema hermaphroditum]